MIDYCTSINTLVVAVVLQEIRLHVGKLIHSLLRRPRYQPISPVELVLSLTPNEGATSRSGPCNMGTGDGLRETNGDRDVPDFSREAAGIGDRG